MDPLSAIRRRIEWRRREGAARASGRIRLTGRHWGVLVAFAVTGVIVAVGVGWPQSVAPKVDPARAATARGQLAALIVLRARPPHDRAYAREAFGPAWTDAAQVAGGGNACDTRNDVLSRDLRVDKSVAAANCRHAVAAGRFRSPYTGQEVVFERGRGSRLVQIDHIVPLAYAWDMGAARWPPERRTALANDPANLVAVDAASNQAKSDAEPARWMPPLLTFWCQYAVQFVEVSWAYRLPVDQASRAVLARALAEC
ncbi:MAG: HNH endonuclease family protein [Gordonia sp. (in: high G+C Gram-positive bacteria)]